MDDRFDRLSRAMADPLGRRHALKLLAVGAAAIGAAVVGLRPASAQEGCTCQETKDPLGRDRMSCLNSSGTFCSGEEACEEDVCAGAPAGAACSC